MPPTPTTQKPTWRQHDALETAAAKTTGEAADFMARLMEISGDLEPHRAAVMAAAQALTDAMRAARNAAETIILAERGYRR